MSQRVSKRERDIWRAAMTLANNICVQESDRYLANDENEEARAISDCAKRIRGWLEPDDDQMREMFAEAGVRSEPDPLGEALNSGDGSYKP